MVDCAASIVNQAESILAISNLILLCYFAFSLCNSKMRRTLEPQIPRLLYKRSHGFFLSQISASTLYSTAWVGRIFGETRIILCFIYYCVKQFMEFQKNIKSQLFFRLFILSRCYQSDEKWIHENHHIFFSVQQKSTRGNVCGTIEERKDSSARACDDTDDRWDWKTPNISFFFISRFLDTKFSRSSFHHKILVSLCVFQSRNTYEAPTTQRSDIS